MSNGWSDMLSPSDAKAPVCRFDDGEVSNVIPRS